MLYYGTSYMIPVLNTNTVIYNISSYNENLNRLNLLPPMDKRLFIDNGKDFDMFYAQWILGNDMIFFDFFKIIYDLYLGMCYMCLKMFTSVVGSVFYSCILDLLRSLCCSSLLFPC